MTRAGINRSFLKWAGGKSTSLKMINSAIGYIDGRLIEPFAGSAVVSLNIDAVGYIIADINMYLIALYRQLHMEGESFINYCRSFFKPESNTEDAYYEYRARFNTSKDPRERAALFLYLNRHTFNGLCRFNSKGGFNVPFGRYDNVEFPINELNFFLEKFRRVPTTYHCKDFEQTIELAEKDDIIYCVPKNSLVYQNGRYLPISSVKEYDTDLGNNNVCVKKHIRHAKNEELVVLKIMGINKPYSLKLSKDHSVFVCSSGGSIIEKKAFELTTKDLLVIDYDKRTKEFIPKYSIYNTNSNKKLLVNYERKEDLAEFLGLFIAEGHLQRGVLLSFSVKEDALHKLTKRLIEGCFGLEAKICPHSPHNSVTQVRCHSDELNDYILEFYNGKTARFKAFKPFVLFWPPSLQLRILRGWLKGDGGVHEVTALNCNRKFVRTNKRNKFKLTGTTSSFVLATQMYNMALRCGLHPCFKERISKRDTKTKDGRTETVNYDVYFTMKDDVAVLLDSEINGRSCGRRKHVGDYMLTRITDVAFELYTGDMYDLTTTAGNFWLMGNVKVHNCDPPYVPLSDTASFNDYTGEGFNIEQQKRLAQLAEESKCKFLISNHSTPFTKELYKKARIIERPVGRFVGASKESRKPVVELLAIYNE